jgi:predicted deacetylase
VTQRLCIVLHDVAPATWPLCERLLDAVDALGAPPLTLLVVPDFHGRGRSDEDAAFVRALERRLLRGDELALHGWRHLDDAPAPRTPGAWLRRRVLTACEGEFSALARDDAQRRIENGVELFRRLGWPLAGFVPPAWLASAGTRAALAASGLRYTSTHGALIDLAANARISAPCVTASPRSRWRRAASGAWLRIAPRVLRAQPLLRAGLHPADALHAPLVDSWRRLLTQELRERVALTKSHALTASM